MGRNNRFTGYEDRIVEQKPQSSQTTAQRVLRSYPVRLIGTIVLVVGVIVLAARMGLLVDEPASSPQPARPAAAPVAQDGDPSSDDVLFVGSDIAPGTYRTSGSANGDYCMWSRHSSASGGPMQDIIASDGAYSGQMIVTVERSDVLFRTRGCAPWERVG